MYKKIVKRIFETDEQRNSRSLKHHTLLKSTTIAIFPAMLLLFLMVFYGKIDLMTAIYGGIFVFILSVVLLKPYITNLSSLINYVKQLSQDEKVDPPDLSFLNNVEELSEAVIQLHHSWETKANQLKDIIDESRILINTLPDIIILLNKDCKIIRTNSTAKAVFGGNSFKEVLEKIILDKSVKRAIKGVIESRVGQDIEYYLPEPHLHHYIIGIEPFPEYSLSDVAIVIAIHDITKQKHTEQILSDFVANASHEIRTPLTSIIGFVETLQTTAKDDPAAGKEFLKIIQEQAERMSKLVNDLLSLSQIERNIYIGPTSSVSIVNVLKEVQMEMERPASDKCIALNLNFKHKIKRIVGDSDELARLFENLIGNAIKYSKAWSSIDVEVAMIDNTFPEELILSGFEKIISISVADKGSGIPEKHIPRLTERFYRVDTAHSKKIGGTGLGLAIVKYILDRHNGTLKIESSIGKGSTFTVLLPVR